MSKQFQFNVNEEKGRIDKVISNLLEKVSRSHVKILIEEEHIRVNGEIPKPNYKVRFGDSIEVTIPDPVLLDADPENIPLEIVYEDKDVVVINKPQGMVVHPAAGHHAGTLVNALLYHVTDLSGINGKIRPGIVHRIDKDTSGLLMVAKNDESHEKLAEQLKDKTTLREYVALVHGVIPHEKGKIEAPIGRSKTDRKKFGVVDGGKDAVTHFEVLERFPDFTLVSLKLETGRTHQIRVHMDYIGYPLAGDPVYGPKKTLKGNGQFLHARKIGFVHPTTNEFLTFEVELPEIFQQQLNELREQL
ncbi:RluA family pseudouridine synthase [Lacticigenium naphthae]|uniref:RluA family pseudouridine synthase n=1 Tax=Lacticigenium naphthae TaxID=515351 RepID=UPI0003F7AEB9|nr:RluA family pseudouridine synthase [Lacticigenium naphthae]